MHIWLFVYFRVVNPKNPRISGNRTILRIPAIGNRFLPYNLFSVQNLTTKKTKFFSLKKLFSEILEPKNYYLKAFLELNGRES